MSDRMTQTILANHIPEVWANSFLGYLPKYLNLANSVTTDFNAEEFKRKGDIVHLPKRGTLVAYEKAADTVVTVQHPSDDKVDITLDQHWEITISPEDVALSMTKDGAMEGHMNDAAMVLGEKVEETLAELYASAGDTVNSAAALTLEKLREGRRKLITARVPQNAPRFAYLDEYAIEDLLNTNTLADASQIGSTRPLVEGSIGRLAGFDIFESQMVETSGSPSTYHDMLYTRDAMGLALRPLFQVGSEWGVKQAVVADPRTGTGIRVTMSYDANYLAPQVTLDILWGVGVIRSEHLIDLYHTN